MQRNKSQSPHVAQPFTLSFSKPNSLEVHVLTSWAFRGDSTVCQIFLVSFFWASSWLCWSCWPWVTTWTVALNWGSRAVHLISCSNAPVCCYHSLCLFENAHDSRCCSLAELLLFFCAAGSTALAIPCGRTLPYTSWFLFQISRLKVKYNRGNQPVHVIQCYPLC